MKIVADLHLHSKYSRAVSPQMDLPNMARWAKIKGINLLGTADFTHPLWFGELQSKLIEINPGIYRLKSESASWQTAVNFVLTTEISSIYTQGGKTRKIHTLLFAPSLKTVEKINKKLAKAGANLASDGRPIIGLSSQQLCELVWSVDEQVLIVPAHAWTPWFSIYGSKSGFESILECYGQFADRIYAVETGLSSDPAMNWQIKDLYNRSLVSFSDAHSPAKLGREATVFQKRNKNSEAGSKKESFSFDDLSGAIKRDNKSRWKIAYTIEFYPEEGKYFYSGHRKCGVLQSPEETEINGIICPVCGKSLTLGVMHQIKQLSEKQKNKSRRPPFKKLVPLNEIIAESVGVGPSSKKVKKIFEKITDKQSEIEILTEADIENIALLAGNKIAEGINKVRRGNIVVSPGYDGVFGSVKIWPGEKEKVSLANKQMNLF